MSPEISIPFWQLVGNLDYPCLGARAAVLRDSLEVQRYSDAFPMMDAVVDDLSTFIRRHERPASTFAAFAVVDEAAECLDEIEFEAYLWRFLRELHSRDQMPWDARYGQDPADATFKYSFAGRAMFVIGLHPHASRRSRRSSEHVIVFNPVWQFENLRAVDQLDTLAIAIRKRDVRWDATINPNLRFEGTHSDALQYSGRKVDGSWSCPYSTW